ncbi:hypothetical protein EMCG_08290 [[Emmonsia] crescens]|uniref:Uncharacterized protein n=1 Tax=[Emmonsia] crescens TaxID=73230 RepID=A0A0G2I5R2_9EURO|nr:hypothetical protein EMCG_08290 [Emmonsia crescens UAMH 3008]
MGAVSQVIASLTKGHTKQLSKKPWISYLNLLSNINERVDAGLGWNIQNGASSGGRCEKAVCRYISQPVRDEACAKSLNERSWFSGLSTADSERDTNYRIHVHRGKKVHDKPNMLQLKLQLNSNATNKTIRELAKQDPHRVATMDVNVT